MTRAEAFVQWWSRALQHADDPERLELEKGTAWRAYLAGYVDGLSQRNVTKERHRQKRGGK